MGQFHRSQTHFNNNNNNINTEGKYSDLPASFSFHPIAVETLGPINESAVDFLRELGRRISSKFQEERQSAYLFQRLSVAVQR